MSKTHASGRHFTVKLNSQKKRKVVIMGGQEKEKSLGSSGVQKLKTVGISRMVKPTLYTNSIK